LFVSVRECGGGREEADDAAVVGIASALEQPARF